MTKRRQPFALKPFSQQERRGAYAPMRREGWRSLCGTDLAAAPEGQRKSGAYLTNTERHALPLTLLLGRVGFATVLERSARGVVKREAAPLQEFVIEIGRAHV